MDLADLRERNDGRPDEAVVHGQDRLGDDRERRLVEEVVRLCNRPDEGALDREHPERDTAGDDRVDHVREGRQRHEAGGREEPVTGRRRVGAFAAGVCDGQFDGGHGRGAPFAGGRFAGDAARRREAGSKAPASP